MFVKKYIFVLTLVKFKHNRMVQTTRNFGAFGHKKKQFQFFKPIFGANLKKKGVFFFFFFLNEAIK